MSAFLQIIKKPSSKAYMSSLLLVLAVFGAWQQGFLNIYQQLLSAVATAMTLDLIINYLKRRKFIIPSSAFITGMIVALVLSPEVHWYIPMTASAVAIAQKHLLRYKNRSIFNPAAIGLLTTIFLFNANINWWGQSNWWLLLIFGALISLQAKKIKIPSAFIICVALIFTIGNYFADNAWINPILYANFFFIFVMLIEPKTSPYPKHEQYIYSAAAAVFSYLFFLLCPQYDFSILALGATNLLMSIGYTQRKWGFQG